MEEANNTYIHQYSQAAFLPPLPPSVLGQYLIVIGQNPSVALFSSFHLASRLYNTTL